jgi:RNA polymerase sigma-70 factor (ECF subfamily)
VICLLAPDLAARLERTLRRWEDESGVEVLVDRRARDRRGTGFDRRGDSWPAPGEDMPSERRRILNVAGRRVAERRSTLIPVNAPAPLPRRADAYSDRLVFAERFDLSADHHEEVRAGRLVVRWQQGDRSSFAELYERYFDRVYAYLRLALGDAAAAEEAAESTFVEAMETLARFELRSMPVRAWLFRIVRDKAIEALERQEPPRAAPPAPGAPTPAPAPARPAPPAETVPAAVLERFTDSDVLVLVSRLPAAQRQVMALRYMLGLSFQEVATVLGRPAESVRNLHEGGLAFLHARMAALGREPRTASLRVPMRGRRRPTLEARRDRFALRLTPAR